MIPTKNNPLGVTFPVGDVSAFRIQITPADISGSTAVHTFFVVASAGCKVLWGDGASSTLTTGTNTCTHTYSAAGNYLIQIRGPHTRFYHGPSSTASKVIEAIKLYSGLTSCVSLFYNCSNALFRMAPFFRIPSGVTDCSYAFFGCSGALFTLVPGFRIPSGVTACPGMFQSCSGAAFTVPAGFTIPDSVLDCLRVFYYCNGAAFQLPAGFSPGNHATSYREMFAYCNGNSFTSLPASFKLSATALNLRLMFYYASKVASDISGIWPDWPAGASVDLTNGCLGMAAVTGTIPASKLWDRTDITWTSTQAFAGCTNLANYASIPAGWK